MNALASTHPSVATAVAEALTDGFSRRPRSLPPWLFYDDQGSELFEQITTLESKLGIPADKTEGASK